MGFIETRPPVTQKEIEDLTSRLASIKTKSIDGAVLSNMVQTCHECALTKGELIDLSIGDVANGGRVNDSMSIDVKPVPLTNSAKKMLQNHIDYLKNNGYKCYPSKPLFPTKHKKRYYSKLLDNHLKNDAIIGDSISLEKIRQSGICNHYDKLRQKELSASQCLEETKIFSRHKSYRATKDLLRGKIQSTGEKINLVEKYFKNIEEVESPIKRKNLKKLTYPEIRQNIQNDPKLNGDEKLALKSEIKNRIQHAKNKLLQPKSAPNEPRFKSISEAIKIIDPKKL
jgi:hypothetical protein